jgi:hypothetical protein
MPPPVTILCYGGARLIYFENWNRGRIWNLSVGAINPSRIDASQGYKERMKCPIETPLRPFVISVRLCLAILVIAPHVLCVREYNRKSRLVTTDLYYFAIKLNGSVSFARPAEILSSRPVSPTPSQAPRCGCTSHKKPRFSINWSDPEWDWNTCSLMCSPSSYRLSVHLLLFSGVDLISSKKS